MPTIAQLKERRATAWEQMKEVHDAGEREGRELTAEERQKWDAADTDVSALDAEIDRSERHTARERQMATVVTDPIVNPGNDDQGDRGDDAETEYRTAFGAYLRRGITGLAGPERDVLSRGLTHDPEIRAQAIGTNSAGGYLVPPGYRAEFIKTMKDFGSVQGVAQVIETETGNPLQWPTMNDTASVGALLAENTQMTELDLVVGTATLDAYMYTSKLTRASYQLVQDSAFDVESTVRDAHAERIGRIVNQHFTTGTGTAQPDGIVTSAVSGVTAATAGGLLITSDELIDLVHSVDPAYRRSPRAKFMLSDAALKTLRKLKDTTGQYLWQPSVQDGVASSLFGYPYEINQDMAVPAIGVKAVLFGDFYAGYVIRIVQGIQVITFSERYADYLQVAWASYMRADGTAQNTAAYRALTMAAA